MKTSVKQFRSRPGRSAGVLMARSAPRRAKSVAVRQKEAKPRKNPRLVSSILAMGISSYEAYIETASPEEIVRLFEESYCSSLVNFLLDLKKSTAKHLFELVIKLKKRTFLDVITMYYYKDYLINPLPLTLETESGKEIPNLYAILGTPREASPEDVKAAHKLLSAAFSAESFPPAARKIGEERLQEIDAAFEILKNPKRRKELDAMLPNISYLYPRRDQSWFEAVNRLIV